MAQGVVQDFACPNPVSISAESPAIVTCPSPHGYKMRAFSILIFNANASNNDTVAVDGVTYTFVSHLDNSVANQILIGQGLRDSAWNFYHAVNDDGWLKGTLYSSATTAHPTFTAGTSFQSRYVYLLYRTPGALGVGKSVSSSVPANLLFDTPQTRMEWSVMVSGGSGSWAKIGTNQTPRLFYARYVDANRYALYATETNPYDASGNGPFAGQSLLIQPASPSGSTYPNNANNQSWSTTGFVTPNGNFQVIVPGCTNPDHELECAQSKNVPEIAKNSQGTRQTIASFTISGGVGTITFTAPFPYTAPNPNVFGSQMNMTAGANVWLRNLPDPPGTWTHTTTLANDSTGTTLNHLVKYVVGSNSVRGIQFHDPNGATGGAIGVCQAGCGTTGLAVVADAGLMACVFDNAHTAGHWVTPSGYDDRCHDAGPNFPLTSQPLGVVQASGPAGAADNLWWNGLNRAYKVQSIDGPPSGSNVTRITINVPGYPDGSDYGSTATLPGLNNVYSGNLLQANVNNTVTVTPYVLYGAIYPEGYQYPLFPAFLKDQTGFDPGTSNRLNFWVKWNKPQKQCSTNVAAVSLGTYFMWPGEPSEQGAHFYNEGDPEIYSGWMKYTINLAPTHQVSINTPYNYPSDLMYQGSALGWHGSAHYFDRMGTFYQDLSGIFCPAQRDVSGQTILISPVTMEAATGEPEELVRARFGQWTPNLFQAGDLDHQPTGHPGYSLSWSTPLNGVRVQYEVRYSTTQSMKIGGFSSGKCQDGTTTCGAADRVSSNGSVESVLYKSGPVGEEPNVWWAIKPISIPVASTSGNFQAPTWIITPVDTGFAAGDHVTISGVAGNSAANQTNIASTAVQPRQTWTRFDPTPWIQTVSSYPANPGGPVKLSVSSHGFMTGQTIQLFKASTGLNGQYTVTVIDQNTFTLDGSSYDAICPCSGGRVRLDIPGTLVSIASDATPSPNTVCTVTTTVPHNLLPGWKFDIVGAPDAHLSNVDAITPSTYTVTNVGGSTSFDFRCPANTPMNSTFNTDGLGGNFMVQSWPGIAIPVAGNGAYVSGGSIFSNEDNRNFAEIHLSQFDQTRIRAPFTHNNLMTSRDVGSRNPRQSCQYQLAASESAAGTRGRAALVRIAAGPECTWQAASRASWLTLNSSTGAGSGTVSFSVAPNRGAARVGEIEIAGQIFTVRQAGVPSEPSKTGIFRQGAWILDRHGDGAGYVVAPAPHGAATAGTPVAGDWNGDGFTKPGLFRGGRWVLDYQGDGSFSRTLESPAGRGGIPVVGDWNGDGRSKAGIFREGRWILDYDGDGSFSRTVESPAMAGDVPVVGDWNGDGRTKLGIFHAGRWILDYNGDGSFSRTVESPAIAGDVPVVGDWNGDGHTKIGIFHAGRWVLDSNGDGSFSRTVEYAGIVGDTPVVGDWNGDGRAKIGIFRPGIWMLDAAGDGRMDRVLRFDAQAGDIPLTGRWSPSGSRP